MASLLETLTAKDPAEKWIKDFIESDDPKFAGKSKEERKKMALGAYYAKVNESTELLEYTIEKTDKEYHVIHNGKTVHVSKSAEGAQAWVEHEAKNINEGTNMLEQFLNGVLEQNKEKSQEAFSKLMAEKICVFMENKKQEIANKLTGN